MEITEENTTGDSKDKGFRYIQASVAEQGSYGPRFAVRGHFVGKIGNGHLFPFLDFSQNNIRVTGSGLVDGNIGCFIFKKQVRFIIFASMYQ